MVALTYAKDLFPSDFSNKITWDFYSEFLYNLSSKTTFIFLVFYSYCGSSFVVYMWILGKYLIFLSWHSLGLNGFEEGFGLNICQQCDCCYLPNVCSTQPISFLRINRLRTERHAPQSERRRRTMRPTLPPLYFMPGAFPSSVKWLPSIKLRNGCHYISNALSSWYGYF